MDTWSYIVATVDPLILRNPIEIALAMLALIAPTLALLLTRSIALAVVSIAVAAIALSIFLGSVPQPIAALWLACVWFALNCLHIAAVMHHRNLLMGQDLLERLTEIDYRINTFLDAIDRRASLGVDSLDIKATSRARDPNGRAIHESVS